MSRILFVADAGSQVGGGHVMRCLTLARALERRGERCAFVAPPAVAAILEAFAPDMPRAAEGADFDAVVFDHYSLAEPQHRSFAAGRPTLVIDDLANRPLGADLVLDVGSWRRPADYDGLVPPHAQRLIGPQYALVREAFGALRKATLARREAGGPVRRILVSLGLTDVGGVTARVVERLSGLGPTLDVVVGGRAPSLPQLTATPRPNVALHVDTDDMARLTAEADLAVGAGGSSSWERCVLGLPTALVVLAPNQQLAADALGEAGAVLPVSEAELNAAVAKLIADPALRLAQSRAAAALCDGKGADRVAGVLVSHLLGGRN